MHGSRRDMKGTRNLLVWNGVIAKQLSSDTLHFWSQSVNGGCCLYARSTKFGKLHITICGLVADMLRHEYVTRRCNLFPPA